MQNPQQTTTTSTYEYSTNIGGQGQAPKAEFSYSTGHHPGHMEHSYSTGNPTKNYDYTSPAPNFGTYGGSSNANQTTTYDYSRTVGNPSQLSATNYDFGQPSQYEKERKSANTGSNYDYGQPTQYGERKSANTAANYDYGQPPYGERKSATGSNYVSTYDVHHHHYDEQPVRSYERTVVFTQSDPPQQYGNERVVKSSRPAPQQAPHEEEEENDETYDFNNKNDLVDLMAEEHVHLKGTEPVVVVTTTTKTGQTTEFPRKSAAELLKDLPITNAEVEKKSHVSTKDHHVEEWSHHKKNLKGKNEEDEYEETRLDYCGLCVSKRRGRKPKY